MARFFFLFLMIFHLPVFGQNLPASADKIIVVGDNMVRDTENNRLDLRGNVQIVFQGQHLYCERATVDHNEKRIVASGEVSLITPTTMIDGDRVELNYETGKGTIYNGFVRSGAVTFEGDVIHKVGDQEYEVENGYYTACKSCPAAWSFTGKRIKAEIGGYAYITQPIFRLADYPFFWLPYLIVPLKSKRQTGFLFPEIGSGPGGFELGQSFFWAPSEHKDFTFTLKNYSQRGLKGLVNHRFYMDADSYGELDTAFVNDSLFPDEGRISGGSDEESIERWFLKYRHYYNLPGDYIQRVRLNLTSDLKYPIDFSEELEGNGEPALENKISLSKNSESWHAHVEGIYYVNLLKTDVTEDNDDAVHRFPSMQVNLTETEIGRSGLLLSSNTNYTNFARNNLAYDDITFDPDDADGVTKRFNSDQDGEFNNDSVTSADQIRTGQRLIFEPKLSYPSKLGRFIDLQPSLSYFNALYQFDVGDDRSAFRSYVRTTVSAKTNLSRVYNAATEKDPGAKLKHEIIPEIGFNYIPYSDLSNHPFFGTSDEQANFRSDQPVSDEDLYSDTGIQFDYYDRVVDRRVVNFSLSNKLTAKRLRGNEYVYQQIGLIRLSQDYDFIEAEEGGSDARPWSDIEGLIDLRFRHVNTNTVINYFPYHQVTNVNSRLTLTSLVGNFVEFTYSRRFIIGEDREVDRSTRSENLYLRAGYISKYFNIIGTSSYSLVLQELLSWQYQLDLKPPGECWGITLRHLQIQGGESQLSFNFSYSFDGKRRVTFSDEGLF